LIVDYAGPGELVTSDTGFKIPLGSREEIVSGFQHELERLAASPELVNSAGLNARARVLDFYTWDRKAVQVAQVYEWLLAQHGSAPKFFDESRIVRSAMTAE